MSDKRFAMLSTEALHSRKIDGIALDLEAVYYRLHMATDKFGTMPGSARDVLSRAFPSRGVTEAQVATALDELATAGLIERWTEPAGEHEGEWLHLTRFDRNCSADYLRKRTRYTPVPPSQRTPIDPVPDPFPTGSGPVHGNDAVAPVPSHSGPVPVPSRGEVRVDSPSGWTPQSGRIPTAEEEAAHFRGLYNKLRGRQIDDAEFLQLVADAARSGARLVPIAVEGEPLHVTGGSGESVTAPGSCTAATSADALPAPAASEPLDGVTVGSPRCTQSNTQAARLGGAA